MLRVMIKGKISAKYVSVMSLFFFIMGCGTMKAVKVDPKTGYFPTSIKVDKNDIIVKEKIDLKKYKSQLIMLPVEYVDPFKRPESITKNFDPFFKQSMINIGYFDSVKDMVDVMVDYVDKKSFGKPNVKEFMQMVNGALVSRVVIGRLGNFEYIMTLEIIDSTTGNPVLKVKKSGSNNSGLDEPVFFPVFNAFTDWINENK